MPRLRRRKIQRRDTRRPLPEWTDGELAAELERLKTSTPVDNDEAWDFLADEWRIIDEIGRRQRVICHE